MKKIAKAFLVTVATAGLTACASRAALAEPNSVNDAKMTELQRQAMIDSVIISAPSEMMRQAKYKPVAGFDSVQKQGIADLFKVEPHHRFKKPVLSQ